MIFGNRHRSLADWIRVPGETLNDLYKRPDPLYLIISDVITSRTQAQTTYLHVQCDCMIIQQQAL
ncbi:hypothetical protein PILCRDRAFT_303481 [Piloderma croceum F 1598]|uniref:Uncharacterized protein n=1 Tax=Piloderma croceum (strain F 1598) TaxID=765440 RepID=A0A0C3CC04_PILCF|nr:hypothetical protein PILCRDRAFT_303481 [Piloderma croceum F 1598]